MPSREPAPPRRVALLLPDMGGGGAERLTVDLIAGFLDRGLGVDLVLQRSGGEFMELVPPAARIVDLAAPRLRDVVSPLRGYLRRERPAALLAAMWPLTTVALVAAAGLPTPVFLSDHCALTEQYAGQRITLAMLRATLRATYRFADGIVAVSDGVGDEIAALARLPRARVRTIYNPVGPPLRSDLNPDTLWRVPRGKRILSVGKLKAQKNHALLLDAMALLDDPQAELAIVGEGENHPALAVQAAHGGLTGQVLLPGFTTTPGDWYAGADLFVLSSDYEGFGNVLVEAMHCGLPVVSTDCPSGPAEVLGQGRWGRLVPVGDAAALAGAMRSALDVPIDPAAQRARAAEFGVTRAVKAYLALMAVEQPG